MNKTLRLCALFAVAFMGGTAVADAATSCIPGASYWSCGRAESYFDHDFGYGRGSSRLGLYTYDGQRICWVDEIEHQATLEHLLDPNAPKPQPVDYRLGKEFHFKIGWRAFVELIDKKGNTIGFVGANFCPCGCKKPVVNLPNLKQYCDISLIRTKLFH